MGNMPQNQGGSIDMTESITASLPKRGRKAYVGGPMNKEEIAMNRELL